MASRRDTPQLPAPDPEAKAHSDRLRALIHEAIAAEGPLPFDRYMAMALYQPGLGYYSAGAPRFGAGGDYTTAPLSSALFSRTLARQAAQVLATTGGDILELGAGTGRMAADVLAELHRLEALPARYRILEVSAALRQEQAAALEALPAPVRERVEWLDDWPQPAITGVILANEVLDALPVKRFQVTESGLRELAVTRAGEGFDWELVTPDARLSEAVAAIEAQLQTALPAGYVSEWCPSLPGWISGLATSLAQGAALLVDYGYPRHELYHAQRHMGTLLCHYRHRAHDDPFWLPGLQDITAFVDFTAVADAGVGAGLALAGFNTQAHFLMGAGLTQLLEEAAADEAEQIRLTQQAKELMMPGGMGERFKVIGLARGLEHPLAGFSMIDQRHRL